MEVGVGKMKKNHSKHEKCVFPFLTFWTNFFWRMEPLEGKRLGGFGRFLP